MALFLEPQLFYILINYNILPVKYNFYKQLTIPGVKKLAGSTARNKVRKVKAKFDKMTKIAIFAQISRILSQSCYDILYINLNVNHNPTHRS